MIMKKKIVYAEPADYIPEELRRKYKLGEFAEMNTMDETVTIETVSQGDGNTTKITLEPAEGSKKLEDDEELEKLFESLDRETAKLIDNQHTPKKRS